MSKCREYALKLLTVKDRSEKEIKDKLSQKKFSEDEVNETVSFLKEYGYINDKAFALHYISDAINLKKWGKARIKTELIRKGIEHSLAENLLAETNVDSRQMIVEVINRRFQGADLKNPKEKNRIFSYFARRGFNPSEIICSINTVCSFEDIVYYDEF